MSTPVTDAAVCASRLVPYPSPQAISSTVLFRTRSCASAYLCRCSKVVSRNSADVNLSPDFFIAELFLYPMAAGDESRLENHPHSCRVPWARQTHHAPGMPAHCVHAGAPGSAGG